MALQAAYKQFLAAPNSSALVENASLHYVTTTTSVTSATDIIKHLATVRNRINKKKEDALFAIENQNVLVFEVETTLEFVTSGGPYLPGMDDNFLADRTVHLPIMHIVTFDNQGKISTIRQSWDQGSLLKQVEVIGRSGQNWPIRDSKEQIKLIAQCAKGDGAAAAPAQSLPTRSRGGSTNILRDPRASLDLFAPAEELEDTPAAVVSPYAGRRPRQRSFTEILGDEPVETPGSPSDGRDRSQSPSKVVAPKVGAGKNFTPIRLFNPDDDADQETPERQRSPERRVRPDPKKYEHFDFDDGSEAPPLKPADAPPRRTKHDSQWSFEDFVTPQKPVATRGIHRARDVRHWGPDNEVLENTPAPNAPVIKPRRDAEAHFELVDDGPGTDEPRDTGRPARGTLHNEGLHLYDNRLHIEDGSVPSPDPPPLGNITNLKDRRKDFDAHFELTDEPPQPGNGDERPAKIPEDRKKAVRMMESNWAPYDESPVSRKENSNPNPAKRTGDERGIAIAGDGMGGRKGSGRGWLTGEDEDETPVRKPVSRGPPTRSEGFWEF
ncbi:hypothetical protein VTK26DRAFT_1437 [Humicola hyalothermophila]